MGEEEANQGQPTDQDLKDQGVKDPGRRRFLGFLGRTAKGVGAIAATAAIGGAFYEAMQPKNVQGEPSREVRELHPGDLIHSKRIAQSVDSDFADPKKELVTTSQRYNEIVDQIVKVNPSLANEPSLRNFDPNSQVALLFALGEKNTGYGQYTATIGEAKLGDKNSIEVDLTYTVPFVDQNGKIVSPANNLPPGVEVEDPNREKVSRPFDLQIISKIKDKAGNPVPIVFKDPVPNVATSPLA